MTLFENYINGISDILNKTTSSDRLRSPNYFRQQNLKENVEHKAANSKNKVLLDIDKAHLENLFGHNPFAFTETNIGVHPDFSDLEHHEYENHYCVSLFMDIKGSTRLNENYSLLEIRKIKDTILTLAIHVCSHFCGHVHRLQGDGIFIQFVRRKLSEQNSVINALNAASILTHFISSDLASVFKENGVEPLTVRTGIDLGSQNDVIWSHYGVPGCSELTTTSLHTDLAAKLQAKSQSNGILVGANVRNALDIKPTFCKDVKSANGTIDYYIYRGIKNYRKFDFDWISYLNSFDFINLTYPDRSIEIDIPKTRLSCSVSNEDGSHSEKYFQNSKAIPKGSQINFALKENGHDYIKKSFETIEWKAYNSGRDAKKDNAETHNFQGTFRDQIFCETSAEYTGHHYIECTIKRHHSKNTKVQFPLFVH